MKLIRNQNVPKNTVLHRANLATEGQHNRAGLLLNRVYSAMLKISFDGSFVTLSKHLNKSRDESTFDTQTNVSKEL